MIFDAPHPPTREDLLAAHGAISVIQSEITELGKSAPTIDGLWDDFHWAQTNLKKAQMKIEARLGELAVREDCS